MGNSMSRILIETVVRKALKDIKESPRRSIRNVIDMALQFSKGKFQKRLFETAQIMLTNESSEYYTLVNDMAVNVDSERLLNFCMNLGYNSCMAGAEIIRKWEKKSGYNVPWSIIFEIDKNVLKKYFNRYSRAVSEGQKLGIYTWILFMKNSPENVLPLIKKYPDSAFFLMCDSNDITPEFTDRVSALNNVMIIVKYSENAGDVCRILRQEKLLYGIYYIYNEEDIEEIANGDLIYSMQQFHPAAVVFWNAPDCSEKIQKQVYELAQKARNSQEYSTLVWELYGDNCFVDKIISDDSCFVYFNSEGRLCGFNVDNKINSNLFNDSIKDILKKNFPKKRLKQTKSPATVS